jgi:hypothetical protein
VEFFEHFFSLLVEQFYKRAPIKRFKGYRLWACDGSAVKLPDNLDTQTIGTHTNQHNTVASVKLLCYFDLLNKLIARLWLKNKRIQEIRLVEPHIQALPNDVLSIYDRNYGAHIIIFLHQHYNCPCLIRMKTTCTFEQVERFLASGQKEAIITDTLKEKAWRQLRKMGMNKSKYHLVTYRLIGLNSLPGKLKCYSLPFYPLRSL